MSAVIRSKEDRGHVLVNFTYYLIIESIRVIMTRLAGEFYAETLRSYLTWLADCRVLTLSCQFHLLIRLSTCHVKTHQGIEFAIEYSNIYIYVYIYLEHS